MDRFAVELRSSEVTGNRLTGHAAVFGQTARIGSYYEQIARSAFDEALKDSDAVFLVEHDPAKLLGRQSSGTLNLWTDDHGLAFEVELPDTQLGHDVRELVKRGDMRGASFGFTPGDDEWTRASDGLQLRTHTKVKFLRDVCITCMPAYAGASAELRSIDITPRPTPVRSRLLRARLAQYK